MALGAVAAWTDAQNEAVALDVDRRRGIVVDAFEQIAPAPQEMTFLMAVVAWQLSVLGLDAALLIADEGDDQGYLVYRNFCSIMRYNPAFRYALTIGLLSDAIADIDN